MAVVTATGVAGGAAGAAYLAALQGVTHLLGPEAWGPWAHLAVLALVGLAVGQLVRVLGTPADVELLVDNIHVLGGAEDVRGLRSLIPASLLCVGAGGALGPEAPLVTTTGTIGSWLAQRAGLGRDQLRIVTISGMAAGFTVLFGAPLGAAVFALEILHRRGLEYHEALLPAVAGSLCGYAVAAAAGTIGLRPIWTFPEVGPLGGWDLGWAVAAGVGGALVAVAFTFLTLGLRRLVGPVPAAARPALGGVVLGLLALASPYALTNGELQLEHLVDRRAVVLTLVAAAGVKLLAASVALVTGWKGGFIIPLFFVGFALGRATAGVLPGGHSWVLVVGLMVAANVGVTKTPLGSALVVTEMAGLAFLPTTLIAAMVSFVLTSDVGLIHTQRTRLDVSVDGPGGAGADLGGDHGVGELDDPGRPVGRPVRPGPVAP